MREKKYSKIKCMADIKCDTCQTLILKGEYMLRDGAGMFIVGYHHVNCVYKTEEK